VSQNLGKSGFPRASRGIEGDSQNRRTAKYGQHRRQLRPLEKKRRNQALSQHRQCHAMPAISFPDSPIMSLSEVRIVKKSSSRPRIAPSRSFHALDAGWISKKPRIIGNITKGTEMTAWLEEFQRESILTVPLDPLDS
jgi:hypothetical protein